MGAGALRCTPEAIGRSRASDVAYNRNSFYDHGRRGGDDAGRLDRLLQRYPGDEDVVWLVTRIESRECRLRRRNEAIREAVEHYRDPCLTLAAKAVANALEGYFASGWLTEHRLSVLPESAGMRHVLLHRILRLNSGRLLRWHMIYEISKIGN